MATHQRQTALGNLPIALNAPIMPVERAQVPPVQAEVSLKQHAAKAAVAATGQKRSKAAAGLDEYNFKLAIDSWDQIGSLASEVSTSVLAQLAAGMSEQLREEDRDSSSSNKRQKTRPSALPSEISTSEPPLVSSDDDDDSNASAAAAHQPEPTISRNLSQQIDRMARMSKYMMQIDHYHRLLKSEMAAVLEDAEQGL